MNRHLWTRRPGGTAAAGAAEGEWAGLLRLEDTALFLRDTGGPGTPVIYLNGSFADQSHWRRVISVLGPAFRHVLYDERSRGRSKGSRDHSFSACVRDLGAIIEARNLERPVLVGWSYGAYVAAQWAASNVHQARGVVAVEGAFPWGWTDPAGHDRIRKLFRRLGPLLPLGRAFGLSARMSAEEHAAIAIENHMISAGFDQVLDAIRDPVRFVLASGASIGGDEALFAEMRASLAPALGRNAELAISAQVGSSHQTILRKDPTAVADAVREIASITDD